MKNKGYFNPSGIVKEMPIYIALIIPISFLLRALEIKFSEIIIVMLLIIITLFVVFKNHYKSEEEFWEIMEAKWEKENETKELEEKNKRKKELEMKNIKINAVSEESSSFNPIALVKVAMRKKERKKKKYRNYIVKTKKNIKKI